MLTVVDFYCRLTICLLHKLLIQPSITLIITLLVCVHILMQVLTCGFLSDEVVMELIIERYTLLLWKFKSGFLNMYAGMVKIIMNGPFNI